MKVLWLVIILFACSSIYAQDLMIRSVDGASMIIFRAETEQGKVKIGKNISITYWVRVQKGKRARYIAMDSSQVRSGFNPIIKRNAALPEKWAGGYLVRDSSQSTLDIHITPRLWSKVKNIRTQDRLKAMEQTLSREGNLSVSFKELPKHPVQIGNIVIN